MSWIERFGLDQTSQENRRLVDVAKAELRSVKDKIVRSESVISRHAAAIRGLRKKEQKLKDRVDVLEKL